MVDETSVFDEIDKQFSITKTPVGMRVERRFSNRAISMEIQRKITLEKENIKQRRVMRRASEGFEKERRGFEKERRQRIVRTSKKIMSTLLSTGPKLKPRGFRRAGPLRTSAPNLFGDQRNPFIGKMKNPFLEE